METDHQRIANSYISHILIAIKAGDRAAPFRDFIDNWYAFSATDTHLLTKGSRPRWFNNPNAVTFGKALSAMHFRSKDAENILTLARTSGAEYLARRVRKEASIRLMVDHAVPLLIIRDMLFDPNVTHTEESLHHLLRRSYRLGVITADEDHRLNALHLQSKMPPNWDRSDVFARYRYAGIEGSVAYNCSKVG